MGDPGSPRQPDPILIIRNGPVYGLGRNRDWGLWPVGRQMALPGYPAPIVGEKPAQARR